MNKRVIKFLIKGLISTLAVCRMGLSQEPENLPIKSSIGMGAFIEGEQERISPAYGKPYKAYGMCFSGIKLEAATYGKSSGKIKNFFFGNTTVEGYVGKLESQCTIKQRIQMGGRLSHLVSVQSDHSLAVKARISKVVLHHKGLKVKIRGEGMYGLGGITNSFSSVYPKGARDHSPLQILKITKKYDAAQEPVGEESLADYAALPDTLLILKRVKVDALVENEITPSLVACVGIYSRWGIWRIGREEIFFNVGKEYCFNDSLGTCFTLTYKLSPCAVVSGEIHIGKSQAGSLSFQYNFGG